MLLGIGAILTPHIATLAVELLLGGILTIGGVFGCALAIEARRTRRTVVGLLLSLITLAAGLLLLFFPWSGMVALTLFLSAYFIATGVLRLIFAWQVRTAGAAIWMATLGALAILLGTLIWTGLPGTAAWVLGLIFGIDLIFYGLSLWGLIAASKKMRLHADS